VSSLSTNLSKWRQTLIISFTKHTAYRLDFFLQIIAPALVFFFINYSLWTSIFKFNTKTIINGYTLGQMIHYQVWVLIVGLLAQGHTSFNLSNDIRLGRISSYLIYPFNLWEFHTASFISFEFIQLFIGTFTYFALFFIGIVKFTSFSHLFWGVSLSLMVGFFWFGVQYLMGLLAFWLDETWVLRVSFRLIASFLSGVILPLDFFPSWLVSFLKYTPFPYMTYYPIKVFMGDFSNLTMAFGMLGVWTIVIIIINMIVWRKGLRLYTAAGM
jgi:ABC-2 type transport system permease protein